MIRSIIVLSLYLVVGCAQSEKYTDSVTEKEVRDFISAYDNAWNAKDTVTVNKLLSDDYIYFTSEGATNPKKGTLKFLSDTAYVIHQASRPEIDIILHNNVATVNSHWIGELSWKGNAIHDNQRCGLTIVKVNGALQLLSEHCVQIAVK
jgi:hypothetical protein